MRADSDAGSAFNRWFCFGSWTAGVDNRDLPRAVHGLVASTSPARVGHAGKKDTCRVRGDAHVVCPVFATARKERGARVIVFAREGNAASRIGQPASVRRHATRPARSEAPRFGPAGLPAADAFVYLEELRFSAMSAESSSGRQP